MKKFPPPPSKEDLAKLEPYVGLGMENVWVVATAQEAQQALAEIMRHEALGFDTESRPTFRKNQESTGPHIFQFSTLQKAYIFQSHLAECHPAVTQILESGQVAKIGFGLRDDLKRISVKFGITPKAVVDLNSTFSEMGYKNQVGARTAIAMLFNRRFAKSKGTTTSDWSTRTLSEKQILYAANDAHAAIQVFHALKRRGHPHARERKRVPTTTLIKKGSDMPRRPLEQCHGGKGALDWVEVLGQGDLPGRQLNFVHDDVLAPGVSIGLHEHRADEEYYYIVSGQGTMTLDDRRFEVAAGDITAVFPGGRHALENTGNEDLRILVFSIGRPASGSR